MRNQKIAIGLGAIAILGGVLIFRTPSRVPASKADSAERLPLQTDPNASLKTGSSTRGLASTPKKLSLESMVTSSKASASPSSSSPHPRRDFEYKKELDDYTLLRQKVFLNDHEQRHRQSLLQNDQFIESLKTLFNGQKPTEELESAQNAAVDLLLDALNGPATDSAARVLKSIIQDTHTENSTLDRATRENLAGVKAEVLYKWSAQEPLKTKEMQQWLPGPVSRRIWVNVLYQQEMNRAESALIK